MRFCLVILTLCVRGVWMKPTTTVTLFARDKIAVKGKISKQPIDVLHEREQSGGNNDWNTYLEIGARTKKGQNSQFMAKFVFFYNGDISQVKSLTVKSNSIGLPARAQKRVFKIRKNSNTNKWKSIGNNQKAPDWKWFFQTKSIQTNVASYFLENGKIEILIQSNNNKDVMDLDYLVIYLEIANENDNVETPTTPSSPTSSPALLADDWWRPKASDALTWQLQLQGKIDTTSYNVDMYDVDLFDTPVSTIQTLQSNGAKVTCYFSAGTYEGWRSDWNEFFPFIKGNSYNGNKPPFAGKMSEWDERWIDIRKIGLLKPIMEARIQLAAQKGCDAVDPDNMDAYSYNGGETQVLIQYEDQLEYNRWIATKAHEYGLAVGLKNDIEQLQDLVDYYDFCVNEQCFQYNECNAYAIFTDQDKAVFGVEYSDQPSNFCPKANAKQLSFVKKKLNLKAPRTGCEDFA